MNRTEQIYAWLITQGGSRTAREIREALGLSVNSVRVSLQNACRKGRLVKDGWRGYLPGRPPMSKTESQQLANDAIAAKRGGGETARERRNREAKERKAIREKEAAARCAKREFERAERARNTVTDRAIVANFRKRIEQPAVVPLMTSEEWIARGNKVQRLKPFEVSPESRFKRINPQERVAA